MAGGYELGAASGNEAVMAAPQVVAQAAPWFFGHIPNHRRMLALTVIHVAVIRAAFGVFRMAKGAEKTSALYLSFPLNPIEISLQNAKSYDNEAT